MLTIREKDKLDVVFWLRESAQISPKEVVVVTKDIKPLKKIYWGLFCNLAANRGTYVDDIILNDICEKIIQIHEPFYKTCKITESIARQCGTEGKFIALGVASVINIRFAYSFSKTVTDALDRMIEAGAFDKGGYWVYEIESFIDMNPNLVDEIECLQAIGLIYDSNYSMYNMDEIKEMYLESKKGFDTFDTAIDTVKERINEMGIKIVNKSTKIISSPKFQSMERTVTDFVDDAKDAIVDFASNAGDAYVDFIDDKINKIKKWWRNL